MAAAPAIVTQLAIAAATTAIAYLLTPDPPDQEGPQLDDTSTTTSAYGKLRTIQYGVNSNRGNVIDSSDLKSIKHTDKVGGKGGKSQTVTTYTYKYDVAVGLGEGPIEGISKIFANERLIYDANGSVTRPSWLKFKLYYGGCFVFLSIYIRYFLARDRAPFSFKKVF